MLRASLGDTSRGCQTNIKIENAEQLRFATQLTAIQP